MLDEFPDIITVREAMQAPGIFKSTVLSTDTEPPDSGWAVSGGGLGITAY
ncbi:hypothetical protein [Caproiciproducens sp.]